MFNSIKAFFRKRKMLKVLKACLKVAGPVVRSFSKAATPVKNNKFEEGGVFVGSDHARPGNDETIIFSVVPEPMKKETWDKLQAQKMLEMYDNPPVFIQGDVITKEILKKLRQAGLTGAMAGKEFKKGMRELSKPSKKLIEVLKKLDIEV